MSLRACALILGSLMLVSGCVQRTTEAPANTAADEAALKEGTQTWMKAYNVGDADTIANLYEEDAVLMPPHAPVASGRAAIREFVAKDSAAAKAAGVTLVPGATTAAVSGDWGWESGSYSVKGPTGQVVDSGSYLTVSHKTNGKWLLVRDTYNSDRPLPAPPPTATK